MHQTLAITGPIYVVIALGFVAVRMGMFSRADMRVLGTYVAKFALPALVFIAISQRPLREVLDPNYMLAYAGGSLSVWAMAFAWSRWRQKRSAALSALYALGMSNSNSGFIGYPIAVLVCSPPVAAVALTMCIVIENLIMIPLAIAIADASTSPHGEWKRILAHTFRQLVRNPIIIAIAAGFTVSLLGVPVSIPLARSLNLLAISSTAVSLFVIGGSLLGLTIASMRGPASSVAVGKLVLHPLAVGALVWLMPPADPALRGAAVVFAGVPMMSIYPILAQKYGFDSFCATALLLATLLSFVTISVLLWVAGPVLEWTG